MTSIYFSGGVRLKTYASASKAGKTTVKIELESTDHYDAASVLQQLDEIEKAQRANDRPVRRRQADSHIERVVEGEP